MPAHGLTGCYRDFISGMVGFLYADAWRTRIDALLKMIKASGR